jgi:hypothetical protein
MAVDDRAQRKLSPGWPPPPSTRAAVPALRSAGSLLAAKTRWWRSREAKSTRGQQELTPVQRWAEQGANHIAFLDEVPDEILCGLCTRGCLIVACVDVARPRSGHSILLQRLYHGRRGDQHNSRRPRGGLCCHAALSVCDWARRPVVSVQSARGQIDQCRTKALLLADSADAMGTHDAASSKL